MVEIKSYPAKNGDAFLVKASDSRFAMMVDGGFGETFKKFIQADLEDLAKSGFLLDLVVATHIDADHISGLLSFFKLNGPSSDPAIIRVNEVLHNSLRSLCPYPPSRAELQEDDQTLLKEIQQRGYPRRNEDEGTGIEISARQGSTLAQLLKDGKYRWNSDNGSTPVGSSGYKELHLPQALIKILGPSEDRLEGLKKWWISEIRQLGMIGSIEGLDEIFEVLCAHEQMPSEEELISSSDDCLSSAYSPDRSITNGSSISFLLEVEKKQILFLGDSWAEDIVNALQNEEPKVYDLIKLSHHGSVHNTSPELLELIDSPNFLISTNGDRHSHPDFSVLRAIVDRPALFHRTLRFNYSTPASKKLRNYQSSSGSTFTVEEGQTDWISI